MDVGVDMNMHLPLSNIRNEFNIDMSVRGGERRLRQVKVAITL